MMMTVMIIVLIVMIGSGNDVPGDFDSRMVMVFLWCRRIGRRAVVVSAGTIDSGRLAPS